MFYNPSQVCRVAVFKKLRDTSLSYDEGGIFSKPRFKDFLGVTVNPEKVLEKNKNLYMEDNKFYYKPHIELYLSNKHTVVLFFESEKGMNDYLGKLQNLIPNLIEY